MNAAALQVLIAKLSGVAEEMSAVLRRSAFSPNIKERADCSAAVFDAQGHVLAQADNIPVHLGSMPASVAAVIEALGDSLGAGDHAIVNDPFAGGTHLNDITVVSPCFARSEPAGEKTQLVGWVANRAHHADVGGSAAGSIPADATEIFQEGLRIPPVRLNEDVERILYANSRTPLERSGDLQAQIGANAVGVARLAELSDQPFPEVLDHGERVCAAALDSLDIGAWRAEDFMDSTGPREFQQSPARLCCEIRVDGDLSRMITFDFTGTDTQRIGNTNAVRAVTESAVGFALRAAVDPDLPANAGVMRRVQIVIPDGTILSAVPPTAVGAGNVEVSQRVADVVLLAFAQALPERIGAASQGTMNNMLVGGESGWVYYETVAGGQGGRPPNPDIAGDHPHAGMSGVHTGMTNTENTPVEVLERSYAMRVRAVRLWASGGSGSAAGGDGVEREVELLESATVSLITERRASQPWGLAGGAPGARGENWLLRGGDESAAERLPDKCTIRVESGDVIRMRTPGGGGWGPNLG